MTPEQKAAFINAQTAMMHAEMQGMIAENWERQQRGHSLAHGPQQWQEFQSRWETVIGYNAVILFFRE